MITEPDSKISL